LITWRFRIRSFSLRYLVLLQEAKDRMRQRQANSLNFLLKIFAMTIKSKVKRIKSLQLKKYRQQEQCFVVEGWKGVETLLRSDFAVDLVAATPAYIRPIEHLLRAERRDLSEGLHQVSPEELARMGSFQTNDSVLAVARMRAEKSVSVGEGLIMVLDDIRDPGNMGTIIRTADWFGIRQIVASENSVDVYNPKVISATMGSFCTVQVAYLNLLQFFKSVNVPVYGAFLEGKSIRETKIQSNGIVVIGNESNGISSDIAPFVTDRITIPGFGTAESLNASVAAGIFLYVATLGR